MPAEIIESIIMLVIEMERREQLDECSQEKVCWSGTCDSRDHFDSKSIERMYLDHLGHDCNCEYPDNLSEQVKTSSCELFTLALRNVDRGFDIEHIAYSNAWYSRIGRAHYADQGVFDRHKELFERDFGLEVWTTHMESDDELHRPFTAPISAPEMRVWLIWPNSKIILSKYDRRPSIALDHRVPTERGYQFLISLPREPSERTLKRWPRALRILGLEGIASDPPELYTSVMDTIDVEAKKGRGTSMLYGADQVLGANVHVQPELKLLMSCTG